MPCTQCFDRQADAYRADVLPDHLPIVAVEAAQPDLWRKYTGREGAVIGVTTFGESAPGPVVYEHMGLTATRIAAVALQTIRALEASNLASARYPRSQSAS
jgi:transketolase